MPEGEKKAQTVIPDAPPDEMPMPAMDFGSLAPMIILMGWSHLDIDCGPGTVGLMYVRYAFAFVCTAVATIMLYLYTAVSSSKDETKVTVTTPPDMSNPEPREEEITYAEHDFREFKKLAPQQIITILIMTVMHWKYDFVRPIVMQSVMLPITILKMPLVKVYLLGKKAEGDLKRPWKPPPSPFAGLMGQTDQVAPAADADAVEVKPLTEKKDE